MLSDFHKWGNWGKEKDVTFKSYNLNYFWPTTSKPVPHPHNMKILFHLDFAGFYSHIHRKKTKLIWCKLECVCSLSTFAMGSGHVSVFCSGVRPGEMTSFTINNPSFSEGFYTQKVIAAAGYLHFSHRGTGIWRGSTTNGNSSLAPSQLIKQQLTHHTQFSSVARFPNEFSNNKNEKVFPIVSGSLHLLSIYCVTDPVL